METFEKQYYVTPASRVVPVSTENALCVVSGYQGFGDESDWDQEG